MTKWVEEKQTLEEQDLTKAEKLRSKMLYKLFLLLIKYSPFITLIIEILYSILAYFNVDCTVLNQLGSVSIMDMTFLYLASYIFRFCYLYRLALYSIILTNVLALVDMTIGIPLSDLNMLRVYLVVLLTGVISFIKFKMQDAKHNKRHTNVESK